MIEPTKITNYDRTYDELIAFLTFCICVAGKNSDAVAKKINALANERDFLYCMYNYPLEENGLWEYTMLDLLFKHRIGQYRRIMRALREVVAFNHEEAEFHLGNCPVEALMNIKGIGPKTACFFVLHSRPNQDLVVIDTHILKFFNEHNKKSKRRQFVRPPSKWQDYLAMSKVIAKLIKKTFSQLDMSHADLVIWKHYSGRELSLTQ